MHKHNISNYLKIGKTDLDRVFYRFYFAGPFFFMGQCLKKHSQPRRDYDDNRIIRGKKPNSPLYNRDSQQHLIKKVTLPKMNDPRQILIKETNTAAQNKQTTLQSNKKLTTPVGLDSDSDDEMIIEGNAGHAGAMIDSVRKLNIDDNSSEGSDEGDDIEWVDDGRDEPMRLSASDVSMAHSTDMHQDHMVLSGKSMEDAGGKASLFAHPSSVPPHMKLSVSGAPMTQSQEARKKPGKYYLNFASNSDIFKQVIHHARVA